MDGSVRRGDREPGEAAAAVDGPGSRRIEEPDGPAPAGTRRARRDAELAREGWVRRFVGGPPRLGEVKELYESLGQEVLLDPLEPEELARECGECGLALSLFRVVYTRRGS